MELVYRRRDKVLEKQMKDILGRTVAAINASNKTLNDSLEEKKKAGRESRLHNLNFVIREYEEDIYKCEDRLYDEEEGTEKWNRLNERKRKIEQTLNTYKAQKSQLESDIQAAASADSASDNAAVRRRRQTSSAPAAS